MRKMIALLLTVICVVMLAGCGKKAEPTRLESVNNQPANVDAYGTISINTDGESTVVYYYDKDSKHYIEQPYRGIYELKDNLEETLLQE